MFPIKFVVSFYIYVPFEKLAISGSTINTAGSILVLGSLPKHLMEEDIES